jgi:hypothetical protein
MRINSAPNGSEQNTDHRAFLVLDDCMTDNEPMKDRLMRLMFCNGRHYRIMLIIAMQYPMGIPPRFRTNVDFAFILKTNNQSDRKRVFDNYAGSAFSSYDLFCQFLDRCTSDRECMVIDNTTDSVKLTDQVFFYKAEPHPNFRIGTQEMWALSARMPPLSMMRFGSMEYQQNQPRKGPTFNITKVT